MNKIICIGREYGSGGREIGEKYEFVKELISPHLNGMFVTPKDVDEMVHHISHTLSEAINMLFSAGSGRSEA